MSANIYVYFDGDCEEALRHYEQHLGAKIEALIPYGNTPAAAGVPEHWHKKIVHARMQLGEMTVMASDAAPGHYSKPQGFRIAFHASTDGAADRVFAALGDGGEVAEALGETFFATRYGTLTDRFAIPWMVLCLRQN